MKKFLMLLLCAVLMFSFVACDEPEQPLPHEHSWDNGTVTTEATCTTAGVKTYTCACGETKTEVIPATGHSIADGDIQCSVCKQYFVKSEDDLRKAVAVEGANIVLSDNITITANIDITKPVTIVGNPEYSITVSDSIRSGSAILISANDVVIKDCNFISNDAFAIANMAIEISSASEGAVIEGCTFTDCYTPIYSSASSFTVKNNKWNSGSMFEQYVKDESIITGNSSLSTENSPSGKIDVLKSAMDGLTEEDGIAVHKDNNNMTIRGVDGSTQTSVVMFETVMNEEELKASSSMCVILGDDINLSSQLTITRYIYIDGNGKTITRETPTEGTVSDKSIILLSQTHDVVIKNLNVSGTNTQTEWNNGEFGIKVWKSTGTVLEDVSVTKTNAGIQVNSSDVKIRGTIILDGNTYGGIGVDQSTGIDVKGSLVIDGANIVCSSENVPAIWLESSGKAEISDETGLTKINRTNGQIYYITNTQNAENFSESVQ